MDQRNRVHVTGELLEVGNDCVAAGSIVEITNILFTVSVCDPKFHHFG